MSEEEKAKGRDAKLGLTGKKRKAEEEADAESGSEDGGAADDASGDEEFAGFDEDEGGVSLVVDEESGKNQAKA